MLLLRALLVLRRLPLWLPLRPPLPPRMHCCACTAAATADAGRSGCRRAALPQHQLSTTARQAARRRRRRRRQRRAIRPCAPRWVRCAAVGPPPMLSNPL